MPDIHIDRDKLSREVSKAAIEGAITQEYNLPAESGESLTQDLEESIGGAGGGSAVTPSSIKKARVIRHLITEGGRVKQACAKAGLNVFTFYKWQRKDEKFKAAVDEAKRRTLDLLQAEAYRRAVEGNDKPIIYKGEITGYYKEYSDNLIMFLMKQLDPSYRENFNQLIGISGSDIEISFAPVDKQQQQLATQAEAKSGGL